MEGVGEAQRHPHGAAADRILPRERDEARRRVHMARIHQGHRPVDQQSPVTKTSLSGRGGPHTRWVHVDSERHIPDDRASGDQRGYALADGWRTEEGVGIPDDHGHGAAIVHCLPPLIRVRIFENEPADDNASPECRIGVANDVDVESITNIQPKALNRGDLSARRHVEATKAEIRQ